MPLSVGVGVGVTVGVAVIVGAADGRPAPSTQPDSSATAAATAIRRGWTGIVLMRPSECDATMNGPKATMKRRPEYRVSMNYVGSDFIQKIRHRRDDP